MLRVMGCIDSGCMYVRCKPRPLSTKFGQSVQLEEKTRMYQQESNMLFTSKRKGQQMPGSCTAIKVARVAVKCKKSTRPCSRFGDFVYTGSCSGLKVRGAM